MTRIASDRPVPLWRLYLRMGGWISLAMLVLFLTMTAFSVFALRLADRFDREGVSAMATVTDKRVEQSTDSDGDRTLTYIFGLDYVTEGGRAMQIRDSVGRDMFNATALGDEIGLRYLASEPHRVELSAGSNESAGNAALAIAALFGLLTLGSFWFPASWAVAAVRARRYGAVETARVTGLASTGVRVNGTPRYRLEWREDSGRTGRSLLHPRADLERFAVGQDIVVYQGIKHAWWQGDVGPRP